MSTTQKILAIVLVISGGYLVFDIFFGEGQSVDEMVQSMNTAAQNVKTRAQGSIPGRTTSTPPPTSDIPAPKPSKINRSKPAEKVAYYAQIWGRDPFAGEYYNTKNPKTDTDQDEKPSIDLSMYELTGISFRGQHPTVLINGDVLTLGDSINGMEITQVLPNAVVLSRNEQDFVLKIRGSSSE